MSPRRHPRPIKVPIIWSLICLGALAGPGCRDESAPPKPGLTAPRDAARAEEALQAIEVWLGKGDATKAETIAETLVEVDPQSPDAREAHAITLVALAAEAASNGDQARAVMLRTRALERYEDAITRSATTPRTDMLHAAGIIAESIQRRERALALYEGAAKGAPRNTSHAIYAGNVLIKMDRAVEAETWFTRAVELDPSEPWGWAGRAVVQRQQSRFDEALDSIRRARQAAQARGTSNDVAFRVSEARILRESGRSEESARLLFALDPDTRAGSSPVTRELHLACESIGAHAKSAQAWAAFHAMHPEDADALFMAAESWLRAGRPEEAASWYRLARDIGISEDTVERMKGSALEKAAGDGSGE